MNLMRQPVLQLNAYFEATRIVWARKALTLVTKGKAIVICDTGKEIYPGIFMPSVIRLLEYKYVPIRMQTLSRKNIFMRDGYKCLYCGHSFAGGGLELDHVLPKSRGGRNEWSNLVSSCRRCNSRKNDRTPEEANMPLIHRPLPATIHTPRFILKSLGKEVKAWDRYLWNDSKGEQKLQFA
jgi:hypothetical protein